MEFNNAGVAQTNIIRLDKLVSTVMKTSTVFEAQTSSSGLIGSSSSPSHKTYLAQLRELSVYADGLNPATIPQHHALLQQLFNTARDMPDRDVERKICRICVFLVLGMIRKAKPEATFANSVYEHLNLEVIKSSGSRQVFAIKSLSHAAIACGRHEEVVNALSQLILRIRYPSRRKVILIGQKKADREYDLAIHVWIAVLLAFRTMAHSPGANLDGVVFAACQSEHPVLARHGFALVAGAAKCRSSADQSSATSPGPSLDNEQTLLASKLLARLRAGSQNSTKESTNNNNNSGAPAQPPNLNDPLCCSFLIQAATTFSSTVSVPLFLAAEIYDALFILLKDKINSGTMHGAKLCSDLVQSVTCNNGRSWQLKSELSKRYLNLLSHLMQAVERYIACIDVGNVALSVILRAALSIGRFLLTRPPSLSRMAGLKKENVEEEDAQHLLATLFSKIERMDGGNSVSNGSIFASAASLSGASSSNQSQAAAHPHAYFDCLRAAFWLVPNFSQANWTSLTQRLLSSSPDTLNALGQGLSLRLFDSLLERVHVCVLQDVEDTTTGLAEPHAGHSSFQIQAVLELAEKIVFTFRGSAAAYQKLVRTWDWLAKLVASSSVNASFVENDWDHSHSGLSIPSIARRCHLKKLLMNSLLSLLEKQFLGSESGVSISAIRGRALTLLSDNVLMCESLHSADYAKSCQLLELVTNLLLKGALLESSAVRFLCVHEVSRLALRLHVFARLSKSPRHKLVLRDLTGRLCDMLLCSRNAKGLLMDSTCRCCVGVSSGSAELECLWGLNILPLPACEVCSSSTSSRNFSKLGLSHMLQVASWPMIGLQDSADHAQVLYEALQQMEAVQRAVLEVDVSEQEEECWRTVCQVSDSTYSTWRGSLCEDGEPIGPAVSVASVLQYSIVNNHARALERPDFAEVLQPTDLTPVTSPDTEPGSPIVEEVPPPPPTSPAPKNIPKPQRPSSAILSSPVGAHLPPPPSGPAPASIPKPLRVRADSSELPQPPPRVPEMLPPLSPTFAASSAGLLDDFFPSSPVQQSMTQPAMELSAPPIPSIPPPQLRRSPILPPPPGKGPLISPPPSYDRNNRMK